MPFNVLLLPLLGGYVFICQWNCTRFEARRYSGQRLVFHAAIAGAVFLGVAFLLTRYAAYKVPQFFEWWRGYVPYPETETGILSFLLGAFFWWPLNLAFKRESQAKKAVERWGDFLEQLLNRSMDDTTQIAVTLTSGKYYTGYVTGSVDPSHDRKYMRLLPTLSGYRETETRAVVLTTSYVESYQPLEGSSPSEQFQLVIPIGSILSASLFDPEVFESFNAPGDTA